MTGSNGDLKRGYKTMAKEIGRYLEATDDDRDHVLGVVLRAFEKGVTHRAIAAHFRKIRLGERAGNTIALRNAINRAITEFRKNFPKTEAQQIVDALGQNYSELRHK